MVPERIETKRLILRKFKKEDVDTIFKSWSNPQNYRYNEITWNRDEVVEMLDYEWPTSWGNYYFIAEDKESGETVATLRFGKYWNSKPEDMIWDFGYNAFRSDDKEEYGVEDIKKAFAPNGVTKDKNWGKGYASEMITAVLEIAKQEGVKGFNSGACIKNYPSLKVMLKNGFEFSKIDEDFDYELTLDMTKEIKVPTKEEMEKIWDNFTKMAERDLQDETIKAEINKQDYEQYYKAITYALFNRIDAIEKLNQSGASVEEIVKLENSAKAIAVGLTVKERENLVQYLNEITAIFESRVGNEDYIQSRNTSRLNLCKRTQDFLTKHQVIVKPKENIR